MINFRPATLSDIHLIQSLAKYIWNISYTKMLSKEQIDYMLNWMYNTGTICDEMNSSVIWEIIEINTEAVGFISCTPENVKLKLNKLYIKPEIQGKGIGKTALIHILETAKTNNFKEVYLTVNKQNFTAIKAYEKAGFKRTDFKVFDIGGGFVMDDYIYSYIL